MPAYLDELGSPSCGVYVTTDRRANISEAHHIDVARRTVTRGESTVHLTPTEWGLLSALVTHAGKTVTHQQLFRAVWGSAHGDAQQYLRVYIAHLRRKVEADPYAPRRIVTEPGVGYRFEPDA